MAANRATWSNKTNRSKQVPGLDPPILMHASYAVMSSNLLEDSWAARSKHSSKAIQFRKKPKDLATWSTKAIKLVELQSPPILPNLQMKPNTITSSSI
jgi:hypothetical protein